MCRRFAMVSLATLVLSCVLAFSALPKQRLLILFSNSSNGILRSCYCPNSPWGGLAKRAWLIDRIRAAEGSDNVLLLDSGDLFPVEADREGVLALLRVYSMMNYDAVAVGDQELLGGLDAWKDINAALTGQYAPTNSFPWLSAGYIARSDGRPIAAPWKIRDAAGYRVGIISVVGPSAFVFDAADKLTGLKLTDPKTIVGQFVKEHGDNLDLVVVLSHQGIDEDRKLAQVVEGVDIIVGGHSQSIVCPPEIVNGVAICQAGKNGENLGILALEPVSTVERDAVSPPATAVSGISASPFEWSTALGRRWKFISRLVPLDTTVDELENAARIIDDYYAAQDKSMEKRLREPPVPTNEAPRLLVRNPIQSAVIRAGETRRFSVTLENVGKTDLEIRKARSKSRWLSVTNYPTTLAPGAVGEVVMDLAATNMDRFFRSEYTITTSDRERVVVMGAIVGRVEGEIPDIIVVADIISAIRRQPVAPPLAGGRAPARRQQADALQSPVAPPLAGGRITLVEFFYAPGCAECGEIKDEVLPRLRRRFGGRIDLREYNILDKNNYLRLSRLHERLKVNANEKVSVYLNESIHLGGLREIKSRLFAEVESLANIAGGESATAPASQVETSESHPELSDDEVLAARFRGFTVLGIALAGLIDGINPCAFATIIFFVTMLWVTEKDRRSLLLVGVSFCVAVFLTYLLLGFGAFAVISKLTGYKALGTAVRWGVVASLLILAALSFKDAWRFHRTGMAEDVTLRLSDGMKQKIHRIIRGNLRTGNLVAGSLLIGVVVTLLESVCTGQVYVPTLVFLTKHRDFHWRALELLVLYNLMFIVPLIVVFVAAWRGTRNEKLAQWSRKNVVWSKILMGLFFLGLMILLAAT